MTNLDSYPEVLDVSHIQRILKIGRRQAYKLVSSGSFHSVHVGSRIKVSKAVFTEWLTGNKKTES